MHFDLFASLLELLEHLPRCRFVFHIARGVLECGHPLVQLHARVREIVLVLQNLDVLAPLVLLKSAVDRCYSVRAVRSAFQLRLEDASSFLQRSEILVGRNVTYL